MAKRPRKLEPQTPSLALSPSSSAKSAPTSRRPNAEPLAAVEATPSPAAPGVKAPEATAPALPDAATLAREIYRLALEQKDAATLLRLAEALYPGTFGGARGTAPVRQAARPEPPGV